MSSWRHYNEWHWIKQTSFTLNNKEIAAVCSGFSVKMLTNRSRICVKQTTSHLTLLTLHVYHFSTEKSLFVFFCQPLLQVFDTDILYINMTLTLKTYNKRNNLNALYWLISFTAVLEELWALYFAYSSVKLPDKFEFLISQILWSKGLNVTLQLTFPEET